MAMVAKRRTRAIELRNSGMTWEQVAATVPYLDMHGNPSRAAACADVKRALEQYRAEAQHPIEEMLQLADMRLDDMRQKVYKVIARPHYLVQGGQIVRDDEGRPIRDDGPLLAAIDRLLKIEERWARLHRIEDAAKELKITLERRTDLEAAAVTEAILAGFDAAQLPADQRMRALEAAQTRLSTIDGEVVHEEEG